VFVIGLIVDTAELKRIGAPVMGVTLLAALAVLAWAAIRTEPEAIAD
jgi:cell shape-determining protein MreD